MQWTNTVDPNVRRTTEVFYSVVAGDHERDFNHRGEMANKAACRKFIAKHIHDYPNARIVKVTRREVVEVAP